MKSYNRKVVFRAEASLTCTDGEEEVREDKGCVSSHRKTCDSVPELSSSFHGLAQETEERERECSVIVLGEGMASQGLGFLGSLVLGDHLRKVLSPC